jgi:type III restriction enzyme
MDTYWVPGVNHLGKFGRWAFAEFTEVYQTESDFASKVSTEFNQMIAGVGVHPCPTPWPFPTIRHSLRP